MTASLPDTVQDVFERYITTEYTTVDRRGRPITWPVTPYYRRGGDCIDVTTGLGYPKKADDARLNEKVGLLFSDPTGSGLENPPMVLVQGTANVDDADLDANRDRYWEESTAKLPGTADKHPPAAFRRFLAWYYTRIYVHVRPERVYVWPNGDIAAEPELYDSHMEEVRSGHDEEPESPPSPLTGGAVAWDERLDELGDRHPDAVLSIVAPDGFPFAVRIPVALDREAKLIRIEADPVGAPLAAGPACVTAHEHDEDFSWQRNFQVRGDLVEHGDGWALVPHRLVGGFEVPKSQLQMYRENFRKMLRFRRTAKQQLAKRR